MKNKILICSLAAALAAGGFIATQTFAAENAAAPAGHGRFLQRIADKLNLTSGQRSQIKAVLAADKDNLAPLLAALHQARVNLRSAIRADGATEASVRAASAKVAAAEADMAVERMKLYAKIVPILTDAQREQLGAMEQRMDEFVDNLITRLGSGPGR